MCRMVERMTGPEHADVLLTEQSPLEELGREIRQVPDRQIDLTRRHLLAQIHCRIAHRADCDARRPLAQRMHEFRQEVNLPDVRHGNLKRSLARGRIERQLTIEDTVQRVERRCHRFGQLRGHWRGQHAPRCADE